MRKTAQQRAIDLSTLMKLLESIPKWLMVILPFLATIKQMIDDLLKDAKEEMRGVPPPVGNDAEVA